MKHFLILTTIIIFSFSFLFSQEDTEKKIVTDKDGKILIFNKKNEFNFIEKINKENDSKLLTLLWSEEDENIGNNPNVDTWEPRIDVDVDGTTYVVYNDNHAGTGLQKIMFSKKEQNGTWSEPIYIDKGGDIGSRNNHFPTLTVSPNGDIHAIYNVWAYENVRNFIGYSFYDASEDNWNNGIEISEAGGSVSHFDGRHDMYSTDDNFPVIVWGYDNRANENTEEVYMKYFDGAEWSADILVSTPDDEKGTIFPCIKSMGNAKAMIIFGEQTDATETIEIRYRIYDETTHTLSDILPIPNTEHNTNSAYFNFNIAKQTDENMIIALWEFEYPTSGNISDTIKCINYDIQENNFELSEFKLVGETPGYFPKHITLAGDNTGNCGIIFADLYNDNISFVEFDLQTGFSDIEVIVSQDVVAGDYPDAVFDNEGNMHIVWADLREDMPGGFVEREVFYKKGTNTTNNYNIVFNITETNGTTAIADANINLDGTSQMSNLYGEAFFYDYSSGTYLWEVSKTNYYTETGEVTITEQDEIIDVSIDQIISVDKLKKQEINIYPNPSRNIFNISLNNTDKADIIVIDLSGNKILNQTFSNSTVIDLSDKAKGIYFIKINIENKIIVEKIIVE